MQERRKPVSTKEVKDEVLKPEEVPENTEYAEAPSAEEAENAEPPKKRKGLKVLVAVLITVGVLLIGAAGFLLWAFNYFYGLTNYETDPATIELDTDALSTLETIDPNDFTAEEDPTETEEEDPETTAEGTVPEETDGPEMHTFEGNGDVAGEQHSAVQAGDSEGVPFGSRYADGSWSTGDIFYAPPMNYQPAEQRDPYQEIYNLLLLGVDKNGQRGSNSDSMMLVTVNYTNKTVTITSFMRDSAALIPGVGYTKLNSAFAIGGAALTVKTFETYYGLKIDNYAWVTFEGMKNVMNVLGGVDLYLTVKEAKYLGIEISEPQVVHLDAALALRHSRDRSSGGNDYGRTQRQRNVVMALVEKARAGSLGDLVAVANAVLPYITHNIDQRTMGNLLFDIPTLLGFTFRQQRIPYDGTFRSVNYNLILDPQATMDRWWAFILGE